MGEVFILRSEVFLQRTILKEWCGRPELNRHRPCGPTDFHTRYGFRRPILRETAQDGFGVWTIPSPWPVGFRCCPSSLYTFPLPGLARDRHLKGFPEFEQFCILNFLKSTQCDLSPLRLPISPRPRITPVYLVNIKIRF